MKTMYKSLIVITLLVFTFAINSSAQSYFPRTYYSDDTGIYAVSTENSFDGGYIVCGYYYDFTGFGDRPFYCKIDSIGNVVWSKSLDTKGSFSSITQSSDSGYVVAGTIFNDSISSYNLFCMKILDNGDKVWSTEIDMGEDKLISCIHLTNDKGYILAGLKGYNPNIFWHYASIYAKLDSVGTPVWCKQDSISNLHCQALAIKQVNDSTYIAVGSIIDPQSNSTRFYITKLNTDGTTAWFKHQAIADGYTSRAWDFVPNDTGYTLYAKAGTLNDNMALIHTDLLGNVNQAIAWSSYGWYGWSNNSLKLKSKNDNELNMVCPGGISRFDSTQSNMLTDHYFFESVFDFDIRENGDTLIFGSGPIPGLKDTYNPQFGIVKNDTSYYWGSCNEGTEISPIDSLQITLTNQQVIESSTFVIRHQTFQIVDLPILDYNGCVSTTGSINEDSEVSPRFTLFPNPSQGIFQIQFADESNIAPFSVSVYNLVGQQILSLPAGIYDRVDLQNQPDGLYLIRIVMGGKDSCQRIIKRSM